MISGAYFKNGLPEEKFPSTGKVDIEGRPTGFWQFYSLYETMVMVREMINDTLVRTQGQFLLYMEGEYLFGYRVGEWKMWLVEAETLKKIPYATKQFSNNKLNGPVTYYYTDSSLVFTGLARRDKLTDSAFVYYPDGKIYQRLFYKNGTLFGEQKRFHRNGTLAETGVYDKKGRTGIHQSYYNNGVLCETVQYKNDLEEGVYRYYYPDGRLWTEKIFREGKPWSIIATYDKNGQLLDAGTLADGNGTTNYYNEAGIKYCCVTYKEGKVINRENF